MDRELIRYGLEIGLKHTSRNIKTFNPDLSEIDTIRRALVELDRPELGPYGCRCQALAHRVTGDGCDICNPEMAAEIRAESEVDRADKACPDCDGEGVIDSGGFTPWDTGINIPCPRCNHD